VVLAAKLRAVLQHAGLLLDDLEGLGVDLLLRLRRRLFLLFLLAHRGLLADRLIGVEG
jgi:hypothetical protein